MTTRWALGLNCLRVTTLRLVTPRVLDRRSVLVNTLLTASVPLGRWQPPRILWTILTYLPLERGWSPPKRFLVALPTVPLGVQC